MLLILLPKGAVLAGYWRVAGWLCWKPCNVTETTSHPVCGTWDMNCNSLTLLLVNQRCTHVTETLIYVCAVQADTCSCRLANSELSSVETILCRAFTEDNEELHSFHRMTQDHYDLDRGFLGSCQKDSKIFFYSIQKENNLGFCTPTSRALSVRAPSLCSFKPKVKMLEHSLFKDPPE